MIRKKYIWTFIYLSAIPEPPCETDGFAGNYDDYQTETTSINESQESFEIHEESDNIEDRRGNTRIRHDKNQRNTNESEESFEIQEESDNIEDRRGNTRIRNDKNQRNAN